MDRQFVRGKSVMFDCQLDRGRWNLNMRVTPSYFGLFFYEF